MMRSLFLVLVLANALVLAWHVWVDPDWQAPPAGQTTEPLADRLELFNAGSGQPGGSTPVDSPDASQQEPDTTPDGCFRLGPLPDTAALQQAAARLTARGITVRPESRDSQVWLGHWVQILGFDSVPAAERALKRLAAAGIQDAYLMQEGAQPSLSLGVFREQDRADHIASAARALGFNVVVRARYRQVVQQWLLLQPPAGRTLDRSALTLGSDRIVRVEAASCKPEPVAGEGPQSALP